MKIERDEAPPIIIGGRVVIGQAILSAVNAGVFIYNWLHPENPIPGEVAGFVAQPITFLAQVWYVNRYGVTQ